MNVVNGLILIALDDDDGLDSKNNDKREIRSSAASSGREM